MVDESNPAYSTISGDGVHQYLFKYAAQAGLLERIQFNTRVAKVVRDRERRRWNLTTGKGEVLECEKLIVATGLHSEPRWPDIPIKGFGGLVIHSVSLGTDHPLLTAPDVDSVAVLGGCKSAIEAANICLNAGKKVYWIIREDGSGAGTIIILKKDSKINVGAINNSRLFSTLNPSIYNSEGFWYKFLHSGKWKLGTKINKNFWAAASKSVYSAPGYNQSSNGQKIRPEIEEYVPFPIIVTIRAANSLKPQLDNNERVSAS